MNPKPISPKGKQHSAQRLSRKSGTTLGSKPKANPTLNGLNLWSVTLGIGGRTLLITTRHNSIEAALANARAALARDKYYAIIFAIRHEGTIDI